MSFLAENARLFEQAEPETLATWLADALSNRSSPISISHEPSTHEQIAAAFEVASRKGRVALIDAVERAAARPRHPEDLGIVARLAHLGAIIGATGVIGTIVTRLLSERVELDDQLVGRLVDALTGFADHPDAMAAFERLLDSPRLRPFAAVAANALCHPSPRRFPGIIWKLLDALDSEPSISRPDLAIRNLLRKVPLEAFEQALKDSTPPDRFRLAHRLEQAGAGGIMVDPEKGHIFLRLVWKGQLGSRIFLESNDWEPSLSQRLLVFARTPQSTNWSASLRARVAGSALV